MVGGERGWKEVTTTATATVPPQFHNKVRQNQAESVWNCRSSLLQAVILSIETTTQQIQIPCCSTEKKFEGKPQ